MLTRKLLISEINKNFKQQSGVGYGIVFNEKPYVFLIRKEYLCSYYPIDNPTEIKEKVLSDLTWTEAKQLYGYIKFSQEENLYQNISKYQNGFCFKLRNFFNNEKTR